MVSNTVGVSTCDGGKWSIRYYWNDQDSKEPRAFFDSGSQEYRFWPLDGFIRNETLYVAMIQVRNKSEGGQFGFEHVGVKLASISNPSAPPNQWKVKYLDLISGLVAFPGVSIIKKGDYVYLYTVLDDDAHKHHPMILTRILLKRLQQPKENIEYLAKDGRWRPGVGWEDAKVIMEKGSTEMSVRFHPKLKRWIAVYGKPEFLSNEVILRTAPSFMGPWSPLKTIYRIPEMNPENAGHDKDTFCYASKEHVEFGEDSAKTLTLTYVCNSFDFGKQVENMRIYFPQTVTLEIPKSLDME